MVWLLKAGRQSGESGVDRYFEQQVRWRHLPMRHQPHLMIYLLPGQHASAGTWYHTCGSHDAKNTHEETHSRNLIIPARLIAANNPLFICYTLVVSFPQG